MTLFIGKAICWNSKGYKGPSGDLSTSGFHKDNGYGHEEWNNSPKLEFVEDNVKYRAFHTENVGKKNVDDNEGDIIVFMYASFNGNQYLVGIAGFSTCLIDKEKERIALAKKLNVSSFKNDAWKIKSIKDLWENDEDDWNDHWKSNGKWLPNWFCPDDGFLWLEDPVRIDVSRITGKKKLLSMYSSHQGLTSEQALKLISLVPSHLQNKTWQSINDLILNGKTEIDTSFSDLVDDIDEINNDTKLTETERTSLRAARLGQGTFRKALDQRWKDKCAVTKIKTRHLLRASHIKPWKNSNNDERLDSNNGLLLSANIDALFDKGLITFLSTGEMRLSTALEKSTASKIGLPKKIKKELRAAEMDFLQYHRDNIFIK